MNPNDQPWTPKPYQPQTPNTPQDNQPPKPVTPEPPTPTDNEDTASAGAEFVWQRPHETPHQTLHRPFSQSTGQPEAVPSQNPSPAPTAPQPMAPQSPAFSPLTAPGATNTDEDLPEAARPIRQPEPSTFFQPHVSAHAEPQVPVQPWDARNTQATQPVGPTQQFGGQMAELPALSPKLTAADKKQRKIFWIIVAALVIVPAITIGIYLFAKLSHDSKQQKAADQQKISYNLTELQNVAKNPLTDASVSTLDKQKTLFTVLKQAELKQVIGTKWGVYYTAQQADDRGDQYSLYDTAIDYQSKKYNYNENAYSNLGVYQVRCIGTDQYNFNDSKLTTSPAWQPASDSTDCKLNTVTMHLNDGMNTGGLTEKQADAFLTKIQKSGAVTVNNLSVATNKDKQYIKVDFNIVPQKQGKLYQGMQNFMNAFQTTGLNAEKHPYTFFGAGGEGAHVQYYIDPATLLPAYARMDSTPILGGNGQPQLTTSWSHRTIEYSFPTGVTELNLDTHVPISFSAWPDH